VTVYLTDLSTVMTDSSDRVASETRLLSLRGEVVTTIYRFVISHAVTILTIVQSLPHIPNAGHKRRQMVLCINPTHAIVANPTHVIVGNPTHNPTHRVAPSCVVPYV